MPEFSLLLSSTRGRYSGQSHYWKCLLVWSICETWFFSQVPLLFAGDCLDRKPWSPDQVVRWFFCASRILTSTPTRAGTVESRLRQLVMKLEFTESLTLAHPFIKGFDQVAYCLNEEEVRAVAQGEMTKTIETRKKEDISGKEGAGPVYSTTFYIGLLIEPKQRTFFSFSQCKQSLTTCPEAGSVGPRRLDISYPTIDFQKQVKMWEKFSDSTMGITIRHIKRSDDPLRSTCLYELIYLSSSLPDYVFDPGERPIRSAQKRTKVGNLSCGDKVDWLPCFTPSKGSGKSNNTSPDMPNKRQRFV